MRDCTIGSLLTYFLYGIEYNVFSTGMVQTWARAAQRGNLASPEIARIANANGREDVLEALRNAITEPTDLPEVGCSLFGYLSDELGEGKIEILTAIQTAIHIAERTGQPKDACDKFRRLQDTYYGFVEETIAALRSKSGSATSAGGRT